MEIRRHILCIGILSTQAFAEWKPVSLSQELYPIAYLESSWGRNISHQPNSKGIWSSSYGALGLKAVTAYESMLLSKRFMKKWSVGANQTNDITDKTLFLQMFTTDVEFYNELANIHWQYLKRNTSCIEQTVYAWRWGLGATISTSNHSDDKYVVAYLARR